MTIHRRGPAAAVLAADPTTVGTVYLGSKYAKVLGFQVRNWASSAKAGAGTDATLRVKLTDNNGQIFYLDAADKDYKTAAVWRWIRSDDTVTGLSYVPGDATGAAVPADSAITPIVASPVTVVVTGATTATDYFEIYLYVDTADNDVTRSAR